MEIFTSPTTPTIPTTRTLTNPTDVLSKFKNSHTTQGTISNHESLSRAKSQTQNLERRSSNQLEVGLQCFTRLQPGGSCEIKLVWHQY
mmetsp:Transcript_12669/g.34967  ORF Transcript_12669/g.34967 Transcript_12669/m.34967 type:complete len:88 (+) Transcript_12669:140-403(+)